jgi:hypothetical protein
MKFCGDYANICENFALSFDDKNWLLHHDNAQPHASFLTWEFLVKTTWLSHPTQNTRLTWSSATFLIPRLNTSQL